MEQNVASSDKILRIVIGIGLISFANFGPETGYNYIGWIGIVPLVTAFLGICPSYMIFGIKTNRTKDSTAN